VIWGRIAELSLLGGLRSGKFLVQVALEELEANNEYDFLVLQATETSRTFYEGLGFVRVGAVAKCVVAFLFCPAFALGAVG
jgi:predicted GNAT family N-acyltransferase